MNEQSQKLELLWVDKESGKKLPAGAGFFNLEFGEYRLKIDVFPEEKQVYVKPVGSSNNRVLYRVEAVIKKGGKFSHRCEIGTGYSDPNTNGYVYMDVGPYNKSLVLKLIG